MISMQELRRVYLAESELKLQRLRIALENAKTQNTGSPGELYRLFQKRREYSGRRR